MSTPLSWSHKVPLERILLVAQPMALEAPEAARAGLAGRFDLASVEQLAAEVVIGREGEGVRLKGRLSAAFHYACRVSREPFPAKLSLPIDVLFLPENQLPDPDDITENPDPWDIDALDSAGVDVAEAVAVTLALSLDPFPRGPAADEALGRLGILSEEQARAARSPFAVLKAQNAPDEG
jgi:uncharacterized metal-binding protein YceD (DUF177 family)